MGIVANISMVNFPLQGEELHQPVEVTMNSAPTEQFVGKVVRQDMEDPRVTIIELQNGRYVLGTECSYSKSNRNHGEIGGLVAPKGVDDSDVFPRQSTMYGDRVTVCFHRNPASQIPGLVVRDDDVTPHVMLIKLDDGRVIKSTECQYR